MPTQSDVVKNSSQRALCLTKAANFRQAVLKLFETALPTQCKLSRALGQNFPIGTQMHINLHISFGALLASFRRSMMQVRTITGRFARP